MCLHATEVTIAAAAAAVALDGSLSLPFWQSIDSLLQHTW